jgi:hypothetical protein
MQCADYNFFKYNKKNYAQNTVIKTPAHRSIQQFGFQLTIEKLNLLFFRAD